MLIAAHTNTKQLPDPISKQNFNTQNHSMFGFSCVILTKKISFDCECVAVWLHASSLGIIQWTFGRGAIFD
jgi:hypothetical protein